MFERFTDRSRKVMALANQLAISRRHPMIGTEHMLLALVKEGSGVGANVLKDLKVDLRKVRLEVEKLMAADGPPVAQGLLPQTPAAKAVILFAIEEARGLNHHYVGTEHFLLGMMRQADGVAGRALTNMGLTIEVLRSAICQILGQGMEESIGESSGSKEVVATAKPTPWWRFWKHR